jgi:hypothetical protein
MTHEARLATAEPRYADRSVRLGGNRSRSPTLIITGFPLGTRVSPRRQPERHQQQGQEERQVRQQEDPAVTRYCPMPRSRDCDPRHRRVWPGKLNSAPARWDLYGHIGSRRKYAQAHGGSSRTHIVPVSSWQQWSPRSRSGKDFTTKDTKAAYTPGTPSMPGNNSNYWHTIISNELLAAAPHASEPEVKTSPLCPLW